MRALHRALALAFTAGCTRTLPPPESPERRPPDALASQEGGTPGVGWVAISTDVPARVERLAPVDGVTSRGVVATVLCEETPCDVPLPYGDYELRFTSLSNAERTSRSLVGVHGESVIVRHVFGQDRASGSIGPIIMIAGVVTLVAATVVAVALQPSPSNPSNGPSGAPPDGSSNPAPFIALGGFGVFGLGMLLTALSPSAPPNGATTYGAAQLGGQSSAAGSLGVRF